MENVYEPALNYFRERLGKDIYAALAYGSQVAGYASSESDYDLILIVEDYPSTIKYFYESIGELSFSALVVDKAFFEEDVYHARHGEFVAGRMYTVFIPLVNEEYIRGCEEALKERTIIEECCDLASRYGHLVEYLSIPLKYFLFSRLRRRMQAYPPVRYSYINTFFGKYGERNTEWSLAGFRSAADKLVEKGVLKVVGEDLYSIDLSKLRCPSRLVLNLKFLYRGVKSYITHGRSAKVPPKIFIQEFQSKIRRGVGGELPDLLRDPHMLLRVDGALVSGVARTMYQSLGFIYGESGVKVGRVEKTGLFSSTYVIELYRDGGAEYIVRKHYSLLDIFKWILLQLWLLDVVRFKLTPNARFITEVDASLRVRDIGVKSLEPILFSWGEKAIYSRYIRGVRVSDLPGRYPLPRILDIFRRVGRLAAYIHSHGYAIGDLKPQNIILEGDDLFLTDLEQFSVSGNQAWDIAEFLYYTYIITSNYSGVPPEDVASAFLEGYLELGNRDVVRRASSIRILRPFLIVTPPDKLVKIRRVLKRYAT